MSATILPAPITTETLAILAAYKLDAWARAIKKGGA